MKSIKFIVIVQAPNMALRSSHPIIIHEWQAGGGHFSDVELCPGFAQNQSRDACIMGAQRQRYY